MIDHVSVAVSDFAKSKAFYTQALAALRCEPLMEFVNEERSVVGFGESATKKPDFWIGSTKGAVPPVHVAFRAASRADVDAFYQAAIAAGGRDNGAPGPRPHYHAHYYGGFVLDPDGHNVEAVCHTP